MKRRFNVEAFKEMLVKFSKGIPEFFKLIKNFYTSKEKDLGEKYFITGTVLSAIVFLVGLVTMILGLYDVEGTILKLGGNIILISIIMVFIVYFVIPLIILLFLVMYMNWTQEVYPAICGWFDYWFPKKGDSR
jgi:hypothetical protein